MSLFSLLQVYSREKYQLATSPGKYHALLNTFLFPASVLVIALAFPQHVQKVVVTGKACPLMLQDVEDRCSRNTSVSFWSVLVKHE